MYLRYLFYNFFIVLLCGKQRERGDIISSRNYINLQSTSDPDVCVHITWTVTAGNKITLRAYAIDKSSGIRKDYSKERKRTAASEEGIPAAQQHLFHVVCADVAQHVEKKTAQHKNIADHSSAISLAFELLKVSGEAVSSSWGPASHRSAMIYFERNILPALLAHEGDWSDEDTELLFSSLVEGVLRKKRSAGIPSVAESSVRKNLIASDKIYQRLLDFDNCLPAISLRPRFIGRHSQTEQIKSLPQGVRQLFASKLKEFIYRDPRLALSMIAMFDCGLRTAEAAAVWLDVICFTPAVSFISVYYQIKDGNRTKILKSTSSYRRVPLTTWGTTMIKLCCSHMPADSSDDTFWVCDNKKLSSTVKKLLLECGLTDDYISSMQDIMLASPEYDDEGKPIHDISAYILRRDWGSRARNICGLSSLEIDYLLGHKIKIPQRKRADFTSLSTQAYMSQKLERFVYDPQVSTHPGCTPYSIGHSTELDFIPYDIIRLVNSSDEPISVKLDIEAVVNSEPMVVIAPNSSRTFHASRYISTNCRRVNGDIIGDSTLKEDIYEAT